MIARCRRLHDVRSFDRVYTEPVEVQIRKIKLHPAEQTDIIDFMDKHKLKVFNYCDKKQYQNKIFNFELNIQTTKTIDFESCKNHINHNDYSFRINGSTSNYSKGL